MHRFESISDPGRNKSHQHASGDEFCMEIIGSQFGGVKLFQYWGFLFGENFEAQTWVEHAIFALRERRLTTWPLRLVSLQRKNRCVDVKVDCNVERFVDSCNSYY